VQQQLIDQNPAAGTRAQSHRLRILGVERRFLPNSS
jgi:hypothetical protein